MLFFFIVFVLCVYIFAGKIIEEKKRRQEEKNKKKWRVEAKKGESLMKLKKELNTAQAAACSALEFGNKCVEERDRAVLRFITLLSRFICFM